MLNQSIEALNIKPDGIYVDGTAGGGGHSIEIAKRLKGGRLISIDRDPDAIKAASQRLEGYDCVTLVNSKFSEIKSVLSNLNVSKIDGMLLDLGVSSYQLDTQQRGFSYHGDAPLDMRMSKEGATASDLINNLSADELSNIFYKYSDERFARRIAERIVNQRNVSPIETTLQLAELISECYPAKFKRDGHPARKVFQALRMAVNSELQETQKAIEDAFELLNVQGRIAIITFHSIEDRLVKHKFLSLCKGCECPHEFPICICGKKPAGKLVFRKPLPPSQDEIDNNARSRSAKLRAIERIL